MAINRHPSVYTDDDYLVELGEVHGMDKLESEYINATYIDVWTSCIVTYDKLEYFCFPFQGFSRKNQYIVTQGLHIEPSLLLW